MFIYNGEHSVTFGTKNTWTDWHLVPTSRPVIAPPDVVTNFVDVPGHDGSVDLTELLASRPTFKDCSGSFTFAVDSDYGAWYLRYTQIANYLHGQRMTMVLSDEPNYIYEGRFFVESFAPGDEYSTITIKYNVSPERKRKT